MNILHVNSYYSSGTFYKGLYDEQIKHGLAIDVYVPVDYRYSYGSRDFGNYTKISKVFSQIDRLLFFTKQKKILKDVQKTYELKKFDIIHAHSLFTNGYAAMKLNQAFKIPYCVALRNTDLNVFFKRMIHLRKTGIRILENASRIIFLSSAYQNEVIEKMIPERLREKMYAKSVVIPNGIDPFWFENIGSPKTIEGKKEIRLLHVGEIGKNKNVQTTLRAMNQLNKRKSSLSYTLTAVGKMKDKKLLAQLTTNYHFRYIDPQKKEELIHIYRDHDIFVMPSIHETFGLVYAEAMSQGLPVIYTRGQGFDGQFDDGEVGYAVDCSDEREIANRVNDCIENYCLISTRCIRRVEKFKWSGLANSYNMLYDEMLRQHGARIIVEEDTVNCD